VRFWGLKLVLGGLLALGLLALPAVASADLLYNNPQGTAIYTAHDNGTDPVKLLSVSQVPGMTYIGDPQLGIDGNKAYLMFDGSTGAFQSSSAGECGSFPYEYPCTTFYSGINATGLYKVVNGSVTRITGAAQTCVAGCTTASENPAPAANGKYYYDQWGCTGTLADQDFTCAGRIYQASISGGPNVAYETTCTGLHNLQNFAPDPVNPVRLAFEGCPSSGGQELDVAGQNGAGDVVIGSAASGTNITLNQPSWSPDGSKIIAYQGSANENTPQPGIYRYNPAGGAYRYPILYAPLDPNGKNATKIPYVFSNPRYLGENTIMFTADNNLYTVPATCPACTFPAHTKLLIKNATAASWTPLSLQSPPPAPPKISHVSLAKTHVTPNQGFKLNVTLNEAAELVVQVSRAVTTRVNGKVHTTYKVVGTVGGNAVKGSASYSVKTVNGHKLKAGTYQVLVLAVKGKLKSAVHQLTLVVT
jgi:hypothetical protein